MTDFTNQFNTPLTPEELEQFKAWANEQPRNIDKEKYDYDIQGWWKSNQVNPLDMTSRGPSLNNAHLTDQFKKPNHPTFSNQSQYNGKNGLEGGQWSQNPDGSWAFTPGSTNLEMFKPEELQDYFKKVEPGNKLNLQNYKLKPIDYNPFNDNKNIDQAHTQMLQDRASTGIQTVDPGQAWPMDKNVISPDNFVLPFQEDV